MAKREKITRAKKVAGLVVTKDNDSKPTVVDKPVDNVTSMVPQSGRPKLVASYAILAKHRAPLVSKVKEAIAEIRRSYGQSDWNDHGARDARYELADETLDYLIERFDHNGFSNPSDRLVMAWFMIQVLGPIGHRTNEVCDLIEKTFRHCNQTLSEHGLGSKIKYLRINQAKRREEYRSQAA